MSVILDQDFVVKHGISVTTTATINSNLSVSSTNTGALKVTGGVGIGGGLVVGGVITATNFVGDLTGTVSTATSLSGGNAGQTPFQTAPGVTAFYGPGIAGQILVSGGTAGPTYVNTGNIYVGFANQSNNILSGTDGQLVYQVTTSTTGFAGPGTPGQVLTSNGASAPLYVTTTTLYVGRALIADQSDGTANFANNINGGKFGEIPYQTGTNFTGFIGTGTAGSLLQMGNASTASFVTTSNIYVNSAVNAQTLFGGTAGQLVYQSAAGTTAFAGPGLFGQFLISNGTNAPLYQSTLTQVGGNIIIASNSDASSTNTGALQVVNGGIGVGGGLFVGGASTFTNITNINNNTGVSSTATGALRITNGGLGIGGGLFVGGVSTFTNDIIVNDPSGSFSTSSGALQIVNGGVGVGGGLFVGGASTFTNITNINNDTSVSSTATGAFRITNGGLGVGGGGFFGGIVTATTFFGSLSGTASLATDVAGGTAGQLLYQIGVNDTGFVGPGTFGQFLMSNGANIPLYQSTLTQVGGNIIIASNNGASSTNSGALQIVNGGVGIGGGIFVGGVSTFTNQTLITNNSGVSSAASGALQVTGGVGVGGGIFVGGVSTFTNDVIINDVSSVHSTATGALRVVDGGVGIGGGVFVGGVVTATLFVGAFSGTANQATNLNGGSAGSIPYQSAVSATTFLNIGAVNSILISNGSLPSWTINPTIGGNLVVQGNLTVQGTTVVVDSTVTNISDPILTIGTGPNNTLPLADDGKDRGIAFAWTGTQAGLNTGRLGFFGFDRSSGFFTFITSASIVNEVVAPAGGTTRGAVDANLAGGTAGQLVYQSAANTTEFVGPGTEGQILVSAGAAAPVYTNTASIYVNRAVISDSSAGTSNFANNLNGGTAGQLVYQSATSSTAFVGPGVFGQFLISNGANAPLYQSTLTQVGGSIVVASNSGSVSTVTGALQIVNGGIGVGGGGFFGGVVTATNVFVGPWAVSTASALTIQGFGSSLGTAGTINITTGLTATVSLSVATISLVTGTLMTSAVNLAGGTAGEIAYQSAANTTAFAGTGTAGQILISGGSGAPRYQNTLTVDANVVNVNSITASTSTTTGALQIDGGVGVGDSVYVGNRVGFVNTGNFSVVYQVYNPATNSLDTVFG